MTGPKIIRLLFALIVFKLLSITCRCDIFVRYMKHPDCAGHNGTNFILETFTYIAFYVCAQKCKETPKCRMFIHNSRTCSIYSVYWADLVLAKKTVVDEGSACYLLDGGQFVGRFCRSQTDCPSPNYRCVAGSCTCNLGYNLNPEMGTCSDGCTAYSNDFTQQTTKMCSNKYSEKLNNTAYSPCLTGCVGLSSTCISFQLYNSHCYLLTGAHSVDPQEWKDWGDCKQHVRNCA